MSEINTTVLIENALQIADQKIAEAKAYSDAAVEAANSTWGKPDPNADFTLPADVPDPPFVPNQDVAVLYKNEFGDIWGDLEDWLQDILAGWGAQFFPAIDACIQPSEDNWLCRVVNDGYVGIPAHIEEQIWERGRSREIKEAERLEVEATQQFAVRGFSLPPGTLTYRMLKVQADAQDKISTFNRDVTIKQYELSVETTRFAIGEMTKLRTAFAQAMADALKGWLAIPLAAADIAKAQAEFEQRQWNSVADYINAMANRARSYNEVYMNNARMNTEVSLKEADLWMQQLKGIIDSNVNAASQVGQVASSAISSQQSIVGDIQQANTSTSA